MKSTWGLLFALLLIVQAAVPGIPASAAVSEADITKFRVYQNDKALYEFASLSKSVAYAKRFRYSHVEEISTRQWVWDNLPRYVVYQSGLTRPEWEFRSYSDALALAKTLTDVHIRDLEQTGWAYSQHVRFQVFQGDKSLPSWQFSTLAEAKQEAKLWANSHIMDLVTNQWVWDNMTMDRKSAERKKQAVYDLFVGGVSTGGTKYAFLQDAIRASASVPRSEVVNMATGMVVYSNLPPYSVRQNGKEIRTFFSVDNAAAYAKAFIGTEVVKGGEVWWTNVPYLQVYQKNRLVQSFHNLKAALLYAGTLENSRIKTAEGRPVWDNTRKLLYIGWNGSSSNETALAQVADTQGLDIDSPTWFVLSAPDGSMTDTSDPAFVKQLKTRGKQVMPVVINSHDSELASAFLQNPAGQRMFIDKLADRLTELGVRGVNLDFEAIAPQDRDAYTAFVIEFTDAMHRKGLTVSIDLPRGHLSWNDKSGYDYEKLAGIVDTVVIMAYDQFWKGSTSPGPVSGFPWFEEGITNYLSYDIPRSKIILGIPFYIRVWKLDENGKLVGNSALMMKDLPQLLASVEETAEYDRNHRQTKYTYAKDGFTYVLWAETPDTIMARIAIAKKYDLAGIAAWRLGYEPAELWTELLRAK